MSGWAERQSMYMASLAHGARQPVALHAAGGGIGNNQLLPQSTATDAEDANDDWSYHSSGSSAAVFEDPSNPSATPSQGRILLLGAAVTANDSAVGNRVNRELLAGQDRSFAAARLRTLAAAAAAAEAIAAYDAPSSSKSALVASLGAAVPGAVEAALLLEVRPGGLCPSAARSPPPPPSQRLHEWPEKLAEPTGDTRRGPLWALQIRRRVRGFAAAARGPSDFA
eukprot:CAMPEP_0115448392 /NCGR_PEP_ID=MMETSP0271-20121206/40465_1 /TAXON_ID=71861 /ORGANISM="Scrippsiella trochoidea, Strain CCMP3099" /LENGTH=224 /DNA_ID=CAMNT_0002874507 /DNA_START=61 /DNA_END=732 /DNA_ORIENTATION=+